MDDYYSPIILQIRSLLGLCCVGVLVVDTLEQGFTEKQGMMARQQLNNTLYPSHSRGNYINKAYVFSWTIH